MGYTSDPMYRTARWLALRSLQLQCEPLCRDCKARGLVMQATDADHVVPIEEGGARWDQANLQSLCHPCHSRKTAADNGKNVRHGCDVHGRPLDPNHHWSGVGGVESLEPSAH